MPRILVVDDCDVDRRFIGGLLSEEPGVGLDYALNGREALEHIERERPDLVVTDLQMPELNGLELVSAARQRFPLLPFILVTSQGSEDIAFRALAAGASSYVPKRLLAEQLKDTVWQILASISRERNEARLLDRRTYFEASFDLENDRHLVSPLVAFLQEELLRTGLCDDSDTMRVGIALEEGLVNALYHGNLEMSSELREQDMDAYQVEVDRRRVLEPYKSRRIQFRCAFSWQQARFVIRDQGPGFDPGSVPDPTDPANLEKVSGRGLLLMRSFMDEVHHEDRGRQVTLVKRRKTPAK